VFHESLSLFLNNKLPFDTGCVSCCLSMRFSTVLQKGCECSLIGQADFYDSGCFFETGRLSLFLYAMAASFARLLYPFAYLRTYCGRCRYDPFYEAAPRSFYRGRRLLLLSLLCLNCKTFRTDRWKAGSLEAQTIDDRFCYYIFHRVILCRPLCQRACE